MFEFLGMAVDNFKDFVDDRISDMKCAIVEAECAASNLQTFGKHVVKPLMTGELLAECSEAQLREDIDRLNKEIKKNNNLIEKTNSKIEETVKRYDRILGLLINQKEHVFVNVVEPYIVLMNKLQVNAKLKRLPQVVVTSISDLNKMDEQYVERAMYEYNKKLCIIPGAATVMFGHTIIEGVKIEFEIERIKEEQERLKAERSKKNAKCNTINKVSDFMEKSYEFVGGLEKQALNALLEFEMLTKRKGYDCNCYSDTDFEIIQNCSNIVFAINQIVKINILKDTGIINPVYKKYINEQLEKER